MSEDTKEKPGFVGVYENCQVEPNDYNFTASSRALALEKAISISMTGISADDVLSTAEKFYQFLTKE